MVSIIICTHNRAHLISYCLDSFARQTADHDLFEVIVVDNKSSDATPDVVKSFVGKVPHLRYVREDNVGLSYARNRGYAEAMYPWVSYVDDDAKAYPNYVDRVVWVIHHYKFDCFGGRFLPWYLDPKPAWLPEDFGLFPAWLDQVGELPAHRDAAGGVIVFRKSALQEIGGFPVHLGMAGEKVGYGEENWVQQEMRKRSHKIGFDPELKIDHLVASYKFDLAWHIRRLYAKGRDGRELGEVKNSNQFYLLSKAVLYTIKQCFLNGITWATRRNYYYQNYVVDSFGFLIRTIGWLRAK